MILGYLDRSEKNIDVDTQRQQIIQYITDNNLVIDIFVQDKDIRTLNSRLETHNHTLIIANIVALGTSLPSIKENIAMLGELNLMLISAKEGYVWKPEDLRTMPAGLDLIINIRRSLSSIVTCKALAERKAQGVRLGRKTPNRKRVLDGLENEIREKLANGETKVQLAKDFGVAQATLYAFLKAHPELKGGNNA